MQSKLLIILCLFLLFSLIVVSAVADATGPCGDSGSDVTWRYVSATGTLYIEGNGATYNSTVSDAQRILYHQV